MFMYNHAQTQGRKQNLTGHPFPRTKPLSRRAAPSARISHTLPQLNRACACGGGCPNCVQKSLSPQPVANQGIESGNATVPAIVREVITSSGQSLDNTTRDTFEKRFAYDFSKVQIHTGGKATESTKAINSLAYTVGNHIVLGKGYRPSHVGPHGRLLAHELIHVTQWGGRPVPSHLTIGAANGLAEQQARHGSDTKIGNSATKTNSLQRAVIVCDRYQAEDTGSARRGNGISINISRSNKRASVSARLEVHGSEANTTKTNTIQNTLSSTWTKTFSNGYNINTAVNATYRPAGQGANSSASQIEVTRLGANTPSTAPFKRYIRLNLDHSTNQLSWVVAHEFGHLLGLSDRYSESFWSKLASLFGGERSATPNAGYENNIMAVDNGRLESRNVQDLITLYTPYRCVRWRVERPI